MTTAKPYCFDDHRFTVRTPDPVNDALRKQSESLREKSARQRAQLQLTLDNLAEERRSSVLSLFAVN